MQRAWGDQSLVVAGRETRMTTGLPAQSRLLRWTGQQEAPNDAAVAAAAPESSPPRNPTALSGTPAALPPDPPRHGGIAAPDTLDAKPLFGHDGCGLMALGPPPPPPPPRRRAAAASAASSPGWWQQVRHPHPTKNTTPHSRCCALATPPPPAQRRAHYERPACNPRLLGLRLRRGRDFGSHARGLRPP